jgi:hypothetical protein
MRTGSFKSASQEKGKLNPAKSKETEGIRLRSLKTRILQKKSERRVSSKFFLSTRILTGVGLSVAGIHGKGRGFKR